MAEPRRDGHTNDMSMLIGQLVAATEAASKGIEALSREARDNATALAAAARSLEIVERTVTSLTTLVKDDGTDDRSILGQVRSLKNTNENLNNAVVHLADDVEAIKNVLGNFKQKEYKFQGGWNALLWLLAGLGWIISTGLAIWEVTKK